MSKTWVHQPWWVKQRDPRWRNHFRVDHSHEDGICDLAVFLAREEGYWVRNGCRIDIRWQGRQIHCGCRMCTDQKSRKLSRRRERHQIRMALTQGDWDTASLEFGLTYWYRYCSWK